MSLRLLIVIALSGFALLAAFACRASASVVTVRDCADCPALAVVPAGSFAMGSRPEDAAREGLTDERAAAERPVHTVAVAAFLIGVTEVTRDQFAAFVKATGYRAQGACTVYDAAQNAFAASRANDWRNPGFAQTGRDPVVCVDWRDANAYADWLSGVSGKRYRLPTEAEWEYVARAGSATARYWGDGRGDACAYANVANALGAGASDFFPCADGYAFTAPVAAFKANAFGLYDMIGNVWEWTQDCYHSSYDGAPPDGRAWDGGDCTKRVARGGSWVSPARHATASFRDDNPASYRSSYLGFRVARTR